MRPAGDAIYLAWSQMPLDLPVGPGKFGSCGPIGTFEVSRLGRVVSDFTFYHCRNWASPAAPASNNGNQ